MLLFFDCESSVRTNNVLSHRFPRFFRLASPNRAVDSPVQLERLFEIVRAFDRFATAFVKNRRDHFHEGRQSWITGRSGDCTMKRNVVYEKLLWILEGCEHVSNFL